MKEIKLFKRGAAETLIPLYADAIHAGFESPAADYEEEKIDLNAYVSKYPAATFFARVTGECMVGSGIFPDDLLVVDRSLTPNSGDIVVGTQFEIWGVVPHSVLDQRRRNSARINRFEQLIRS
jgi:DNA polymerase V